MFIYIVLLKEMIYESFFRPTPPIDVDILKSMTIRQFVGYAPNPKKGRRNQVNKKPI